MKPSRPERGDTFCSTHYRKRNDLTRQKYMLEYFSCALKVQRKGKIND
jgi:hypothetical protein